MLRQITEPVLRFSNILSRANTNSLLVQSYSSSCLSSFPQKSLSSSCCSVLNPIDNNNVFKATTLPLLTRVRDFHCTPNCASNYAIKFDERKKRRPPPPINDIPHLPDYVNQEMPNQENNEETRLISHETIQKINEQIKERSHGRLFAVIQVAGKQFKVTPDDIIIVQCYWAPRLGDRIRFEKILLTGGSDFTVLGRPLLPKDLVRIEGTVIEKTLSYTKLHYILKKRKNYRRLRFYKTPYTMVRINSVEFDGLVNETKEIEGERNTIF